MTKSGMNCRDFLWAVMNCADFVFCDKNGTVFISFLNIKMRKHFKKVMPEETFINLSMRKFLILVSQGLFPHLCITSLFSYFTIIP
jgi:hypothetical protein